MTRHASRDFERERLSRSAPADEIKGRRLADQRRSAPAVGWAQRHVFWNWTREHCENRQAHEARMPEQFPNFVPAAPRPPNRAEIHLVGVIAPPIAILGVTQQLVAQDEAFPGSGKSRLASLDQRRLVDAIEKPL